MLSLIIVGITIILIFLSILFFPNIKIKSYKISTYWPIALISALLLIITNQVSIDNIISNFTANTSVNPIKILILFISMTILSIFLDEVGFFKYIAVKVSGLFSSQVKLFFGFYFLISLLTVFTSNDIIILTFTPFICYYAKNTKINPIPYLVLEFVAANTWSMVFIIGNPTNIYLASSMNIDFITYFKNMIIPTIVASIVSLTLLYLLFKSELKKPMSHFNEEISFPNRFLTILGIIHLLITTILLAISSYIGFEMWIISLCFAISLLIISSIYLLIKYKNINLLKQTLKRAPYSLIPYVISMFIIVLSLNEQGITKQIETLLNKFPVIYSYGISGTVIANLINNIPMSVLFSNLLTNTTSGAIYASIVSSNLSAFITPMGALAGIMWLNMLKNYKINFGYKNVLYYGAIIGIPTLLITLAVLFI